MDDLFNTHWHDRVGHVLFYEARPGQDAASRALLDATCGWLQRQGCTAARFGFLYGWQLPLTICLRGDRRRHRRRTAEKLGGRIRRNFVVYRRDLA